MVAANTDTHAVSRAFYSIGQQHHDDLGHSSRHLLGSQFNMPIRGDSKLLRVVLTGGPCAGKTTALARLAGLIRSLGYDPYPVPEVASLLISAGARTRETVGEEMLRFQRNTIRVQFAVEDAMLDVARATGRPSVIVYDRGILDAAGFLDRPLWRVLLLHEGLEAHTVAQRYDLVIHLATAVDGALESYTTAGNAIRLETAAEARLVDQRLRDAWSAHPRVRLIGSRPSFEEKIQEVIETLRTFLTE